MNAQKHELAAMAVADAAPDQAKAASIHDIIVQARALNIPWSKIFAAVMIAAAGGFTPASIAAAIVSLFGPTPPTPALQAAVAAVP